MDITERAIRPPRRNVHPSERDERYSPKSFLQYFFMVTFILPLEALQWDSQSVDKKGWRKQIR